MPPDHKDFAAQIRIMPILTAGVAASIGIMWLLGEGGSWTVILMLAALAVAWIFVGLVTLAGLHKPPNGE